MLDLNKKTKAELVELINSYDGPMVTMRARKDVLIEILMERHEQHPMDIKIIHGSVIGTRMDEEANPSPFTVTFVSIGLVITAIVIALALIVFG